MLVVAAPPLPVGMSPKHIQKALGMLRKDGRSESGLCVSGPCLSGPCLPGPEWWWWLPPPLPVRMVAAPSSHPAKGFLWLSGDD